LGIYAWAARGSACGRVGARDGRAIARAELPNERSEQDSRAPKAHRRGYTPLRDESMRRYVEVAVTSA